MPLDPRLFSTSTNTPSSIYSPQSQIDSLLDAKLNLIILLLAQSFQASNANLALLEVALQQSAGSLQNLTLQQLATKVLSALGPL